MALIKCPECKKKVSDQINQCPNCGRTITDADKELAIEQNKKSKKHKKIALIVIIVMLLACVAGGVTYYFVRENNKRIEEQNKAEAKNKAAEKKKKKEEEERKKEKKNKGKYKIALSYVMVKTDDFRTLLEKYSIYVGNTWLNCIYETKDKDTDKWTMKKNGKFKDFSKGVQDCVSDLFGRKKFYKSQDAFMKSIEGWRKVDKFDVSTGEYSKLTKAVDEYIKNVNRLVDIVSQPEGNYNAYTDSVNKALDACSNAYADVNSETISAGII